VALSAAAVAAVEEELAEAETALELAEAETALELAEAETALELAETETALELAEAEAAEEVAAALEVSAAVEDVAVVTDVAATLVSDEALEETALDTEIEMAELVEAVETVEEAVLDVASLADDTTIDEDPLASLDDDDDEPALFEELFELTATVQFLTSWISGWPLTVIGVNVMTQVCVRGPAGVMELVTVVRVVG
jgi:hypothetical protein